MKYLCTCILTGFLLAAAAPAQPTSTNSISLQAKLGGVTGGTVNLAVRFYAAATGGTQVGPTINLSSVPVTDGVVSVPVSPVDPAIFNGDTRWMGISVNSGPELTPRTLVTAVPYALASQTLRFSNPNQVQFFPGQSTGKEAAVLTFGDATGWKMYFAKSLASGGQTTAWFDDLGNAWFGRDVAAQSVSVRGGSQLIDFDVDGAARIRQSLSIEGTGGFLGPTLEVVGTARCTVLEIWGGSDIAEPASVTPIPGLEEIRPGMVMVIDRQHDGKLVPCTAAYDRAVAGVISGANDLKPGLVLRAQGQPLTDGEHPLAMTGRVWVWCDASVGAIHRGDRLTTSSTPGHAMRVDDPAHADGAVIGKAMTELTEGKGLVLVLVNLQ